MKNKPSRLRKLDQDINNLASKINAEIVKKRKQETRKKIELGGLVIKAGLDSIKSNVLLGILCDAKEKLSGKLKENYESNWLELGKKEFGRNDK